MALIFVTPDPALDGDGDEKEWWPGASLPHYSRIIGETGLNVRQANQQATDSYLLPAGIDADATGTLKDFRVVVDFEGLASPDIPYTDFAIFLDDVQQGETKDLRTDGARRTKMLWWQSSDATPFSVDCAAWYAGVRELKPVFSPSGGGGKSEGFEEEFGQNE
jgi:hypothetical protein